MMRNAEGAETGQQIPLAAEGTETQAKPTAEGYDAAQEGAPSPVDVAAASFGFRWRRRQRGR